MEGNGFADMTAKREVSVAEQIAKLGAEAAQLTDSILTNEENVRQCRETIDSNRERLHHVRTRLQELIGGFGLGEPMSNQALPMPAKMAAATNGSGRFA